MLGRLPSPTQARFRRVVELYAQLVCQDQIVEENIPLINDIMADIGNDLDIDFSALLEAERLKCSRVDNPDLIPTTITLPSTPPVIPEQASVVEQPVEPVVQQGIEQSVVQTFDLAEYENATSSFFRQQFVAQFKQEIEQHSQLLETLRRKPENHPGTQKEYREKNKARIEQAQELVAELKKKVTRFKNNDLEEPDKEELRQWLTHEYEKSGGTLTDEQREYRIQQLIKLAFESQIYEFFPTPKDIIEEQVLPAADIQPGQTVLEPSAGTGNIAAAIREAHPGVTLHLIEYNDILREILQLRGYQVVGTDTMAYTGTQYDRILMNPPFDMGVDIIHVTHCYKHLLKPGGRLVAIMSKRAYTDKQSFDSVQFSRLVDKVGKAIGISNKRYSEQLERAMTIDVILVELQKPLHEEQVVITYLEAKQGDRIKNLATQSLYTVESTGDEYILRNTATMLVERLTALPSDRFALVDSEQRIIKPLPTRSTSTQNASFKQVSVITARTELTSKPDGNHLRPDVLSDIIKPYVIDGANYAIESLERRGGFLLADGTGTGKTIQQLLVADTMLHRYNKPVLIFTESDQIIQQSFFGDARKLGMHTPDAQELQTKVARKPKNYRGLYDPDTATTTVYRFNPHGELQQGINVGTYHDISLMFPNDPLVGQVVKAYNLKRDADRQYSAMRKELHQRKGLSTSQKKGQRERIREYQANDSRYADLIKAEDQWFQKQAEYFGALAQSTSVLIFDECHNLKNTQSGTLRADRGLMLTDNAKRVMFVSATPSDKAGDIFYLKRAGIYRDEEHFKYLMQTIGYYWVEPVYNDNKDMIRRGEWKTSDKFPTAAAIAGISRIFDRLTEDRSMLKREIELANLKKNEMVDIKVEPHVQQLMQKIDDVLTEQAGKKEQKRPVAQILMEQKWALEPLKIDKAVELAQKAVDEGRSVIIFADLKDEGNEKAWGERKAGTIRILRQRLAELYGEEAIGVIVGVETEWEQQQRLANINAFQKGDKRILLATISSGGTGISLDDTIGNAPRTMIVLTAPMNSIKIVQALGRVIRANTRSDAEAYFLFCDVAVDQWLKNIMASKIAMLGGIVAGQVSLLQPDELEKIESAGDEAAVAAFEQTQQNVRPHTLSNAAWGREIDGLKLPAKVPLLISRQRVFSFIHALAKWDYAYSAKVRAHSLQEINRWAKEHGEFIHKYAFERKSTSHEGTYYEAVFSDELWQTVLNMVQFENVAYTTMPTAIFQAGDAVVATVDILDSHVTRGTPGSILQIRPRPGYTLYRVQWSNGTIGETVEQFQLAHPEDLPPLRSRTADSEKTDEHEFSEEESVDTMADALPDIISIADRVPDSYQYRTTPMKTPIPVAPSPVLTLADSPHQIRFRRVLQLWYDKRENFNNAEEIEALIRDLAHDLGMQTILPPSPAMLQCPPLDAEGERCISPACLQQIQACIDTFPQTKFLHIDLDTGDYTAERMKLHEEIINSFKEQKPCVRQQPIAILTGGATGSGKSTFLKKFAPWLSSGKLYHIDADEVRTMLPEYKGWNATNTHLETKDIVDRLLQDIGTPCTHDLIYDGTMNKSKNYLPLIDKLNSMGYQTFVIYLRVPKPVSIQRALSRYQRTGRFVPMEVIDEIFEAGETAMRSILERVDGYVIVNGLTQEIVERGGMNIPADREYSSVIEAPSCCEGMADPADTPFHWDRINQFRIHREIDYDTMTASVADIPQDAPAWVTAACERAVKAAQKLNFSTQREIHIDYHPASEHIGASLVFYQMIENEPVYFYEAQKLANGKVLSRSTLQDTIEAEQTNGLVLGTTTTIETPGRTIEARYALLELSEVIVSHNPRNFAPNPHYPEGCQQRDYERDPAEQQKVTMGAKNFDPRFALAITPTATDGAAIVNRDNICLGGNGRTMMMKLVPQEIYRQKYVDMLREIRCMFGFTLAQIEQFHQPVVVRLVDMKPGECALFSNILNTSLTQKQDITTRTISLARQLSPELISIIADLFEESGKDTVAQMLSSAPIVYRLQKLLRDAGIVTDQNVSEFFADSHTFTAEGRMLFEGILLGAILPDRDFIEAARSYTDKLIRTLPLLIRMQRLPEQWNLTGDIQEVIILEAERRAAGVPLNQFLQQTTFDREEVKEKTELLWKLLEMPAAAPWKTFLQRYIRTAEQEMEAEQSGGGFWEESLEPVEVIRRLRGEIDKQEQKPSLRDRIDGMSTRIRKRFEDVLR